MVDTNSNELASRAQYCLHSGQFKEAQSLYAQLCEITPQDEEVWLLHAVACAEAGMLNTAINSATKAIKLDPTYVEAYLTKAHLLQRSGELEKAIETARLAVIKDDEYAEAWLFLAGIAGQLHRAEYSEACARKVITFLPDNVDAYMNLANAQYEQGEFIDAEQSYKQVQKLQPGNDTALLGVAKSLLGQNRYDDSIAITETILQKTPQHIEALKCLAVSYMNKNQHDDAIETFQKIIDFGKPDEYTYLSIAKAYTTTGNLDIAIEYLRQASGIFKESTNIMLALAELNIERGEINAALECYKSVIKIEPENLTAKLHIALTYATLGLYESALEHLKKIENEPAILPQVLSAQASALERLGRDKEAYEIIERLITDDEIPASIAIAYAQLCHRFDDCDKAIELLKRKLSQNDSTERDTRLMLFSLGNLYDRQEEYDSAFEHYKNANKSKNVTYDNSSYSKLVDQIIAATNGQQLTDTSQSTIQEAHPTPIFIVGMPRSGTSLIEQILASHPDVYGGGERKEITEISNKIASMVENINNIYPENLSKEIVQQLSDHYFDSINDASHGALFITDKMPTNFEHLLLINTLFPNARIIHCTRNPLDTCLSCYFQEFTGYHNYAYNLDDLAEHYLEYERLMDYYCNQLNIPMLEVRYEELIENTELESRKLIEYCGLTWDDRCLNFHKSGRIVRTASYNQVREPIYKRSVNRWKNYQKHISIQKKMLEKKSYH